MENGRSMREGKIGFVIRKIRHYLDELEAELNRETTVGRPSIDWKIAARIWYAKVQETVTFRDLAVRFKVGESTVRRICSGDSPAEIEYFRQTRLNADDDVQAFIKWRDQYL